MKRTLRIFWKICVARTIIILHPDVKRVWKLLSRHILCVDIAENILEDLWESEPAGVCARTRCGARGPRGLESMEPPSFSTTGPQVVRAAPGSDANLVLPLPSGSPPFHYEWSRAGAKLDDRFKPTDGAGGVRLTISTVSTGDSGVYTLQASNAAGKDTTRVRLEVSPDEKPIGEDPPTFLRRLQDLTVKVGTRTRFLVEIVSSTECRVTWYRNERRLLEAERIALVRDGNFWCADISAISVDDAGRWTCTAENVGGRASCSAHLNVLVPKAYKRPEFVEELRALLTEQGTVSLECKVVGVPTPVLRWFKDSREIKAGDVFALTANAEDPTSLGTYTCEAVNCMGRAYSSSKVHVIGRSSRESSARPTSGGHVVFEPPPIFTKELEDQFVRICEPLTLSCNIIVPPWPRSIVWYNKEGKIEPSEKYRILEDGVGGYLLEVPSAEWPDEGEWKCVATSSAGRIGITTCYVSMDVPKNYRKPRFMENLQAVLTEEGLVSFECKVVGFPTPVLSWFKDGQELKPGDVYQLTGTNSLGSYCCIARNCMGQASSSAELTVEDIQNQLNEEEKLELFSKNQAPKFLQGLKSVEAKIDEPFRFTIKVAIPPEPTVLWYRDDQPVDESSRCHLGKEERGVLFLDIQSLEFMDQAEWKCVAMNDFGHSVTSCFLKLIIPRHYKKPRFLENLQAILSDEGAVNLECKVIGVPQPVLKWYKDGEELKPGDIHRIISGQDGTCCLGTYTCEAQNCMGIAASSASLLGFEDSIKTKGKKKEDEQTLQRNLSLSTIHEERTSQMYDTPVGDITLDDKGEISFSFDGKEVSVSLYETPDLTEEEALQIVEMYADQLSENVTEHNVVELPPLRFVKETSTSGNLLMEAIIIDVSPEYFTSPEEDLRTEADVEDISIADENGPPQLSLDQEMDSEGYLEKTMPLISDEKANYPKKPDRKKSDSQKSADDYFSLSRDQSLSEEKKDDDTQALSESDLQSFASAHSSGKVKSKSSKPSVEDGQESSDITKTVLLKDDLQTMRHQNETDLVMKNKREWRSRSSRKSSSGSEISLNKMREDVLDSNFANTLVATVLDQEKTTAEINTVNSTITKLINDVQVIERDIILKSELMSTAATASRSLEIINSLITPLSEIHSIAEAIKESINDSLEITISLFNRLPQPLSILNQSLTIIEKCIDLQSENKTLVKKTCTNIIEKCAGDMNKLVIDINSIVNKDCPFIEDTCVSSIQTTNNEILNTITCSVATIKEYKEVSQKIGLKLDKITPELKHLQKTQKAVYELRNPLQSLLYIAEGVYISGSISLENVTNTKIILNDMSVPIQALQTALEQIEFLSVTETQSGFQTYNTEIMETVMDSVIKLRTSFEQLSVEAGTMENIDVLEKVLVDVKHNINEISTHLDLIEAKIGPFDVLQSENKLEALQKMAQILINLENNLVILDIVPCMKMHMADFHQNLTKVLEHVIESNEATKYLTFLDICDGINRLNSLIKNIDANDILSLAGISNNLKIIKANFKKNEFTSDLNFSINSNITDLLVDINETMNHADTSTYSMISENLEDFSIKHYEEGKLNIVSEQIEKAISTISNVVALETTKDLDIKQAFNKIIPSLEEIKCCVASLTENVNEQEENISNMSNFTFTQAVANPLCDLNHGISVIYQMICEKALDYCENEIKVELVTPLLELRNALEILQQDVISQKTENLHSFNIISSVVNAVQSVQSCIIMIQEQDLLENADDLSTLEDISAIKTSADILLSSVHILSPSVNEITTEIDAQVPTDFETQIVNSVSTQILRNLNDHILILQRPEIVETLDELSKHDECSSIQPIMTGVNTLHCAIEDILHPVTLEESQELSYFVSPTQLSAIIRPAQELHDYLSVLDINNMLVEGIIKRDETKCLSQYLSKLEHCLQDSVDCINVAIETACVTLEISTRIEKLRKLCVELKYNLDMAKNDNIVDSSKLIILDDSLNTVLDTTNCNQEINIARVKLSLERLQQNIASVQDDILGFAVVNPVVLHHETKILKSVADIEKTIASLAVLQFVDISQISDLDFCDSQQIGKEVNNGQSKKIENIFETIETCIQQLPLDMPNNNNLMFVKDFVKIFNDEITLLCCLFNQKPTPKRIIKMLQLFYDLNENLKQYQLNQEISCTSADFNIGTATLEECLQNFQALLLQVLDTQKNLVFNIPISNIANVEIILNKILESNKNESLHHFVKLLMNTIESIKPCFANIHTDVVMELKSREVNLAVDDDTDKNFALLYKHLSEKKENEDIESELDFSAIFRVIQNYADCKHVRGTGRKVIYVKCISECLNVLNQTLNDLESRKRVLNAESTSSSDYELNMLLAELSAPFEIFYKKIMNVCTKNLQSTDKSNILKGLDLLQSQEEAINIAKVAEKILKCENLFIGTTDYSTKTLAKDFVGKINSIEKSLENLESAYSIQKIMNIQPIKEIEKILTTLLTEEVIREEKSQYKEKTVSLLRHMEQYIEIIEIVEEVSAVIKLNEFKKSADIVRELRDCMTSETNPDIHLPDSELNIREEQIHLAQNLQKALTTLQTEALEQDLVPLISEDIRQKIIEVVSGLQNDLVALTNTPVVLDKPMDQNYITLIQEEENIASPFKEIQKERLAIINSEGNLEESLNFICTDLTCELPKIMEIEGTPPHVEVSTAKSLEMLDEKQLLELKSDTDLINSNIQDLSAIKFDQIKESLVHHINDYLCQDVIEDIKKLLQCQNFEQLEQSLRIAAEVRDRFVMEDIDRLPQQVFLKKQSELVLNLQEVMLRIHSRKLFDVNDELLQSEIENKSLLIVKSVVRNLLNSLQMYIALLNTIIQAEVLIDDSTITSKQTCEENGSNSTIAELKICDENLCIKEDPASAIVSEYKESVQEFRQETDNCTIFEEDNNLTDLNTLPEDISKTNSVGNVNDESMIDTAPTLKVIFDKQKLDEKALKSVLTEPEESYASDESSKLLNFAVSIENITDMNIINAINVQEETECNINYNLRLNEGNILLDSNAFNDTETVEVIPANTYADKEKSNAVLELETLLQEVNKTLHLSENYPVIQNSEGLQDILEEVQTVILKLKCDFDGSTNDRLNENIEDLECNVRSVQLQINENCPPALLKEACGNLQTLAACINNVYNTQSTFLIENNTLRACTDDAKQALELLDEVSCLKVDINLDNIILNLNNIKDTMKSLKSCFIDDAESLILKGIEVVQHLNHIEDKVFALEKELEVHNEIDVILRDSIIAATHSIYGTISNMRGNLCSIQKKYMYDNYGKPTDNFLKSIKNVNVILSYDKKDDWKKCAKSLRTILKHFEDIKFYINFDKTARLPSDSAFTKIILSELSNMLSAVVLQNTKDLDMNITDRIEDALNYVSEVLTNMENRTTLEVKEKIPIFKEISIKIYEITDKIKILLEKSIINESSNANETLSKQEEIVVNIPFGNVGSDEKDAQKAEELKKEQQYIERSEIQKTESDVRTIDINPNENKVNTDNQNENGISTLEWNIDSIVPSENDSEINEISQDKTRDVENEHLNIEIVDQEFEIKLPNTITMNTGNIESGSIKAADGIQNKVEEITIFDTADKNILLSKEEKTYYNTGISERENVLDEKTMISGNSLTDIGIKHVIDTIQESVEKETQKTNLEAEKIATYNPNQYVHDNFALKKQELESEKFAPDDSKIEQENILSDIGMKNTNNDNNSKESVNIKTENKMTTFVTNENKEQFDDDFSRSIHTIQFHAAYLTLEEQQTESEKQLHIQTRKPSEINNEDIKNYKNIEEKDSKIQCKEEISSNEIEANVTLITKNEFDTDKQIDHHDITSEPDNQLASQSNERVEQTAVSPGEVLTSSVLDSVVTVSLNIEKERKEQSNTTTKQLTPEDSKSDIAVPLTQQKHDEIISLNSLQYTERNSNDGKDIKSKINDSTGENIEEIQQYKEQDLNVESKIGSFKVEEDLLIEPMTNTECGKFDGKFAESQEVLVSVSKNIQGRTEFKDDLKNSLVSLQYTEQNFDDFKDIETNIKNNAGENTEKLQQYKEQGLDEDSKKESFKVEEDLLIETMTNIESGKFDSKFTESQEVLVSLIESVQSKVEFNDDPKSSLDSLQYTEQKCDDVKYIETKIKNNAGENTEEIQQYKEQGLDEDSMIESFKVEEDLLIKTLTNSDSGKFDGKFVESQAVLLSVFKNIQSRTEIKDDPKNSLDSLQHTEQNYNDVKDIETKINDNDTGVNTEEIQQYKEQGLDEESNIESFKVEEDLLIETITNTQRRKFDSKLAESQEVLVSLIENVQSRTEFKDPKNEIIENNTNDIASSESIDPKIIEMKADDFQGNFHNVGANELDINDKKIFEGEEIEKANVVKSEVDINVVKDEHKPQVDIAIVKYDKSTLESHIKPSEHTEKRLEDGTKAKDNKIFSKVNKEQHLQKTFMDIENIIQEEKINKSEIIREVDGALDLLKKGMTEDTEKFGDLKEIQKDKLSIEICESKKDEGQDIGLVFTSNEILNVDENVIRDIIVPEIKKSDIPGSKKGQITEIIKKEKENENQLTSAYGKPSDNSYEELFKEKEPIKSTLNNNNEKNLNDKEIEIGCRMTLQEVIESKHPMKTLVIQKSFDIETSKELISSFKIGDTTEITSLGNQSELVDLKSEKESICEEDFKDKIDNIEPNIKSESEKAEIEVILPNTANQKEIDSNASNHTMDVNKENKDVIIAHKQNIESMNEEQGQPPKRFETIENVDTPHIKYEKQDEKPKLKVKKSIKANSHSFEKSQKSKTRNVDKELIKKTEEGEHQYRKDMITEENNNNKKSVNKLGEHTKIEGDKNNEQEYSHTKIPEEIFPEHETTKENEASAALKNREQIDTEQNIPEEILQEELTEALEVTAVHIRDHQQQQKIEEEIKNEHLEIKHKKESCTLDGDKIKKKNTDRNQKLIGIENIDKSDKQLGVKHLIETGTLNVQMEVQEDKQQGEEERAIKNPHYSQQQQKVINAGKIDKDINLTNKDISPVTKANEFEILKSVESSSDKHISLIEEGTGSKKLQKTETDFTEFQEDVKHTLPVDYRLYGQSAYFSHELLGTVEEKIVKNSADIQRNTILSINETKLNSQVNKHKEIKQRPSFIDRNEPDYEQEFARPPGYTTKSFDNDNSPMEIKTTSKSPTIHRAQTLIHESQLKSSLPPDIEQRSHISEGRTEHKQRSNTTSDSRSTISDKRASYSRDFKRKPVFSTYLTDRTAVESSRVKLTCSVLSSIDPEISWYKNGVLLDHKHKCRVKYVDGLITLEILNVVPSDSGEYSCTVKNENGSITSSANLKVYPSFEASPIPPTFTRSLRDFYHLHENELVLECRIRGQPLPTITWLKDNRPIILNERYQAHYLADGVCRLTIQSPNEDDSGKYTCKAENSMWSDQITHEVYFTSKESRHMRNITTSESICFTRQATESRRPHFTNVLSDHKVVTGGTIGLQVEISGSPTRVEWLREGRSVTETYSNAQTYIDRGLYTLALSDVTEKESGLYTCRAWSTQGPVEMNASIIVVQPNQFDGKPAAIISRPVKDLLISIGEDLNISFRVQGEPKPKVFFMKGIRDITNSQRVCKMTSDDYVKFTLKRSVISDAGTYCVFVRNAYGCDRAFVTVAIRQRASSDHLISDWTYPMDDLAILVVDRNYQSVPDRIPSEPSTVDGGNNWVSLAWPKPVSQVKAPILAYKVESWLLGKEGGARWVELGMTPRNCFDAFNLKQGEEYHFRVTPRNRYGWGESVQTSTPIGIGLAGDRPEFIEILPGQLKVLVGETATLWCSFKGNPMPEIVWMKNGHEVEEETERVIIQLNGNNTSLLINDIKTEDEGRYSCEATNVHGRSSSYSRMAVITDRQIWAADAKLKRERSAGANGEYPPQFTMRLRDRRVQATYPVRLTCQVIGSPSPLVTWFKDGEEVSLDSRRTTYKDEYFYTLEIAPTTLDDGGVYEAMARNGSGAISCRCNLVVDKGIRAYIAPEFCCGFEPLYRVYEGDELRISAVVEAYPSVGVAWYRDGVRLRPSRRAIMTLDRNGQIELALASVATRDAGVYTCTASNEVGRASTSGKVEVVKGEQRSETPKVPPILVSPDLPYSKEPKFIKKPRSSEACEGDTVIIECEVIGDPKPEVYWLRDFLKPDYYRDASHFKRVGAGPAYRFEIPHAKFDYTGAYSIVAKNVHGEAKAIISLQILAKDSTCSDDAHNIRYGVVEVIPRFEKDLKDLLCYDGDAIEFECRVSGNPEPDIRWFHYTELLPECPDFETSYDLGTARLKIKQVTAEDEGTYSCEASNNLGKATSSACLVIYPPGEPNTLSQRLRRPPALLSASSTPRSTPRTTPARSLSRTPGPDLRRLCSPSREIAPKFYTYPYNRVVEEGDTVVFQCAVKGLPPPWTKWDKDGIIITPTARISTREKDDMYRMLEIEQVTIEDVGLYRVTLENDYGRAEASARLEVISQTGKFYGSRSYSVSPRKCLPYRRRTPSLTRQD